jgi:hypothetical protein
MHLDTFRHAYRNLKGKLQNAADRGRREDEDEVEGDWQTFDEVRWSLNHAKLLYMISKYAVTAQTMDEEETWIRMVPLLVMIYEGVVAGVLDFDYAPQSTLISQDGSSRRCFMNVTQEGKSAIDDLREQKMLNGLKLSSEDFQPITAFQCSVKGLDFVKEIPMKLKQDVDGFIYAPKPFQDKLLLVQLRRMYDEEEGKDVQRFFLTAEGGYEKMSSVTETEDVSYVASPYLPLHVRKSEKPMTSNAVSRTVLVETLLVVLMERCVEEPVTSWACTKEAERSNILLPRFRACPCVFVQMHGTCMFVQCRQRYARKSE